MIFFQNEKIVIGTELIGFRESRLLNYGYCVSEFLREERKDCSERWTLQNTEGWHYVKLFWGCSFVFPAACLGLPI